MKKKGRTFQTPKRIVRSADPSYATALDSHARHSLHPDLYQPVINRPRREEAHIDVYRHSACPVCPFQNQNRARHDDSIPPARDGRISRGGPVRRYAVLGSLFFDSRIWGRRRSSRVLGLEILLLGSLFS